MAAVECELSQVVMSEQHDRHIIVLKEKEGKRKFPIIIGLFEVFAIHRFINKEPPPRPMTHELLGNILGELDIELERVTVTELRNMTFYARILFRRDGEVFDVDSRPSDAIALAVLKGAPIFVEESVLDQAARETE